MDFFKKRRVHVKEQAEDEDVVVKTGSYRLYFHNYYTLISLTNDFLIGGLYTAAALIGLFDGPVLIANLCYLGGALFLILRPIIKIFRNIYLYREEEFNKKYSYLFEEEQQENQQQGTDDTIEVEQSNSEENNKEQTNKE